ncbi:MFS transporter [Rhodococcus pyridinivorans]
MPKISTNRVSPPMRRRWFVPLLCWLALVADGYDVIIYGSTLPAIICDESWGVTTQSAALVGSLSMIGVTIGAVSAGMMTDILGRRKLFLVSVTLFSVAALGCALASNFAVFGFWRIVSGLGIGGILPTIVAIAAEFSKPHNRSRTVGLVMTGVLVGGLLGSTASLLMLETAGFRPIYAIGAIALVTILPVAFFRLPESPAFLRTKGRNSEADRYAEMYDLEAPPIVPTGVTSTKRLHALFEGRSRWVTPALWVMMFIVMLLTYTILTWLPQILVASGMELETALKYFVYFSIAAVVGTAAWAFLADRVGPKAVVSSALGCGLIGSLMLTGPWVAVGVLTVGFATGSSFSYLLDHIAGYYPAEIRATGLGWASGFGRLAGIAGPAYGGFFVALSNGDVAVVAWALAVPSALGAILMSLLPRDCSVEGSVTFEAMQSKTSSEVVSES